MTPGLAALAALALFRGPANAVDAATLAEPIRTENLRARVTRLASPEFLGRQGPGAARAARYIAEAFEKSGLKPAFGTSYYQPIPSLVLESQSAEPNFLGRNVVALIPGTDPGLKNEWVLLSAHYDHIGVRNGVLYPGADDNASGVAMLLEVSNYFAAQKTRPRRTMVFAAFDLEERGLLGAMHFAGHPPLPFHSLKAMLNADMLGRSMANVMDEYLFVLGSEHSPELARLLARVPPEKGLAIGRVSTDLIGTRSDYGPFRDRKVPYLFFSTGQHPDYHRRTDLPDRIDYEKLRRASTWIARLFAHVANDDIAPSWDDRDVKGDLDEIRTVQVLVRRVLAHPELFELSDKQRELVSGVEARLTNIIKSGTVTGEDRTWLLWSARMLLATVF
jgi:hypothetical protein